MRGWLIGALLCLSLPLCAAERIVSLAPFLTDMIMQLEADAKLVGVLDDPSLPPGLRQMPRVGAHQSVSLERIVALRPDLVLAWPSGNSAELLARLQSLGIRVRRFDPQTLDQIEQMTLELGKLLDRQAQAAALSQTYRTELTRLKAWQAEVISAADLPRVFVQLWGEPIFTPAGEQLLTDALRHCGARNVFESLPGLAPQISVEAVLAAKPDVIIALADDEQRAAGWLRRWQAFPDIPAVQDAQLWTLESDALVRPTPSIIDGMRRLCTLIQSRPLLRNPASS